MENPETDYAIAPDGVYLAYQTLGTGEPPPRLADGLAGEHRLRVGATSSSASSFLREIASFTRVITHDQRGIGLSSRTRCTSRSGDQSGGSAGRAGCRRCGSRGLVRYLQLGRRQRAARGDGPGAGAFARVDGTLGANHVGYPTTPGGKSRVPRGGGCAARRCGAPPDTAPPTSSTRPRSATPLPTEFGDFDVQAEPQRLHARCRETDGGELVRDRCAGGLAGGQMSDAPADQGWPATTRKPTTSPR